MDVSLSYAKAGLPSVSDGYSNLPDSLLVEDQGVDTSWMLSSPSLDMEIALQQLSSIYDSELSEGLHSSEELDVSGVDPFLEYINEMLMEEGMEDTTCRQQEAEPSYRFILDSLYDIIGECSLPSASPDSMTGEGLSDFRLAHKNHALSGSLSSEDTSGVTVLLESGSSDNSGTYEQHVSKAKPNLGIIHDIGVSRAVMDNLPICLEQGRAEANHGVAQVSAQDIAEHLDHSDPIVARKGLKQGMANFETLLLEEKSLSYEDLKVKAGYAELYIGERSNPTAIAKPINLRGEKKKPSTAALKGKRKGNGDIVGYVDIREVLISCAQAVSMGDAKKTIEILHELYQVHGASANGNALQRVAHYFSEALVSRLGGMGGHQWRTRGNTVPFAGFCLRVLKLGYEVSPYIKIEHYFANQSILKAAEGASRLHIVEFGSMFGMQWPCLINALADRKGGPPLLVITCIEHPQPGDNPVEKLEETGRRLAAYARTYNVPFQYHAIATDRWEDINSASLQLQEKEVLVVNCMMRLNRLADEPINVASTISPREKFLTSIHSLNPHLLLTSHVNAAFNSPFFVSRFREALYFFCNMFDMLEAVWGDSPERLFIERSFYALDIQNVVACEGAERVQRAETYKQWGMRTRKAGFKQLPIPAYIVSRSKFHVKQQFHKDFLVHDDAEGWLQIGWKGRTSLVMSAWAIPR